MCLFSPILVFLYTLIQRKSGTKWLTLTAFLSEPHLVQVLKGKVRVRTKCQLAPRRRIKHTQ